MVEIRPQAGPQEAFLSSSADIVFYGGAAGGGKTWALLLEPLRHINNKDFAAVIFRRNSTQVRNPGGLWTESSALYPMLGATGTETVLEWKFPSGALVKFAHMEHEKTRLNWQGAQIPLIAFDELTHFTRKQVFYMFSRNRSMCGVKPYIRGTCNPVPEDDEVGGWIHEFIDWYIDEDGYAIPERAGVIRWFVTINDSLRWADTPEELEQQYPDSQPKSFTFIPSSVYDNKILLEADPGYLANLKALTYVEQMQLLRGNWKTRPEAGKVFNRGWFEIIDVLPNRPMTICRFWDLAATEKELQGDDPDFTASVKMGRIGDTFYVLDCIDERMNPAMTDTIMLNTAKQDGQNVRVRFEVEGGASGKRDAYNIVRNLAGFDIKGIPAQGDKLTRAKGLAAQAYAGNVKLLRGDWNQRWLSHMHGQPDLAHDDIMDASSGAFNELVFAGKSRKRSREY